MSGEPARATSVACLCCDWTGSEFAPFGRTNRPNAQCPGCAALERHRLVASYLERRTTLLSEPARLLHFAPEKPLRRVLSRNESLTYVAIDLGKWLLAAESHLLPVQGDICALPFRQESFDAILCNHVLEHIPDDRAAMQQMFEVLRPGGWGIMLVPLNRRIPATLEDPAITTPEERERQYGQRDHVRLYGRDYENRLREAGFEVTVEPYARQLDPEEAAWAGIKMDEDIYLCRRPA